MCAGGVGTVAQFETHLGPFGYIFENRFVILLILPSKAGLVPVRLKGDRKFETLIYRSVLVDPESYLLKHGCNSGEKC